MNSSTGSPNSSSEGSTGRSVGVGSADDSAPSEAEAFGSFVNFEMPQWRLCPTTRALIRGLLRLPASVSHSVRADRAEHHHRVAGADAARDVVAQVAPALHVDEEGLAVDEPLGGRVEPPRGGGDAEVGDRAVGEALLPRRVDDVPDDGDHGVEHGAPPGGSRRDRRRPTGCRPAPTLRCDPAPRERPREICGRSPLLWTTGPGPSADRAGITPCQFGRSARTAHARATREIVPSASRGRRSSKSARSRSRASGSRPPTYAGAGPVPPRNGVQ